MIQARTHAGTTGTVHAGSNMLPIWQCMARTIVSTSAIMAYAAVAARMEPHKLAWSCVHMRLGYVTSSCCACLCRTYLWPVVVSVQHFLAHNVVNFC